MHNHIHTHNPGVVWCGVVCGVWGVWGGWVGVGVKISRGAPLEVQNGTQQDLNKMIDFVNLGGKKSAYMLKMWGFEMGPNKIWIK